ncbi:MAG: AAA family ATPase [Gammaproteobacteria bacterium]|nr:AAA family ATPase [Gammaproteobacteria bacterium]MDE0302300.1 AAA family ATPase [Gammaproteobacteria bacterium]MDE0611614.1 AAA family ATPase [Gammaproteobacteria bacterium]
MADFSNPFRPGAGHKPPWLAGRQEEREEFLRLLEQEAILDNMVLTGLRGVGKTVLLDSFKPLAMERGWIWVGTDLSESASMSEDNLATRLCTDLSPVTSHVVIRTEEARNAGFVADTAEVQHTLDFHTLLDVYKQIPGLSLDKTKGVLEMTWNALSKAAPNARGIIFAYDEAQNLEDRKDKEQHPLSLLLDSFQSLQRKGFPLMLVLTGLPTLSPKLVEARTFSERMFRVMFLDRLSEAESEEAIRKPVEDANCPVYLSDDSADAIVEMSGGYPYFIQFICREVYDAFIQRYDKGEKASVPAVEIEQKLDSDFFAGRWARATDRQRELLTVIAWIGNGDGEFTVQEVVEKSEQMAPKPFGNSHVHQMLAKLTSQGLVYKNRYGRYSFAVPLLGRFIRRQENSDNGGQE